MFGHDYVARNCHPSRAMPGIYTIGGDADAVREVEQKEDERNQSRARSRAASDRLKGAEGQPALDAENATFSKSIWKKRKETWEAHRSLTFGPTWGAEARFASDYRARAEQWTEDEPPSLADLLAQAQTFAGSPPVAAERLSIPSRPSADDAVRERLRKPLVPASDQPIAELVAELECADWVKEGLPLLRRSSGHCPFCQQPVDHALAGRIASIFDAAYEDGIAAIRQARAAYASDVEAVAVWISEVTGSPHLEAAAAETFAAWRSLHQRNLNIFDRKLSAPSSQVELEVENETFAKVQASIDAANAKADHQTNLSQNFARERSTWQEAVWKRFIADTRADFAGHERRRGPLLARVEGLRTSISQHETRIAALKAEIAELRRGIAGIEATAEHINGLLRSQGHNGFHLLPASGDGTYAVQRADGSSAGDTLSEGERSFLAFAYLYHHLAGDHSNGAAGTGRVVVIDDPMTSQDAAAVHKVAAMVRKLFEDACTPGGRIAQVIVLTHNAHFHHEISSYWKDKPPKPKHWILRKPAGVPAVTDHGTKTPIMTAYRALWDEVNDLAAAPVTLCNAMRRILEHYFKFIGGRNWMACLDDLDGPDALAFSALRRSLNDGSHGHLGAEEFYLDPGAGGHLRSVFRRVFEFHQQGEHHMMMSAVGQAHT